MNRRIAIKSMIALATAPAIVKLEMIMPVKTKPFVFPIVKPVLAEYYASKLEKQLRSMYDDAPPGSVVYFDIAQGRTYLKINDYTGWQLI